MTIKSGLLKSLQVYCDKAREPPKALFFISVGISIPINISKKEASFFENFKEGSLVSVGLKEYALTA